MIILVRVQSAGLYVNRGVLKKHSIIQSTRDEYKGVVSVVNCFLI